MILGDHQLEGSVYISMNQGQAIWSHVGILQASMTVPAGKPRVVVGDAL
jgi:hypothetical protein